MAKNRTRFRPDPTGAGVWNKLYITPQQRRTLAKWSLYGLVCVAGLILQDAALGRMSLFGGRIDLAPCAILLICVLEGSHTGSIFTLIASMVFVFSGSAPGTFAIAFLTVYGVLVSLFREQYLRRSFASAWLCCSVAVMCYELSVFLMGLFLGNTYGARFPVFAMSGVVTVLTIPVLYPMLKALGKIGGETWKE